MGCEVEMESRADFGVETTTRGVNKSGEVNELNSPEVDEAGGPVVEAAEAMNGKVRSSAAEGRARGSRWKHADKKVFPSGDRLSGMMGSSSVEPIWYSVA